MLLPKLRYLLPACFLAAVTAGCASNIPELIRMGPPTKLEISDARLNPKALKGSRVRWGGNVVAVENFKTYTLLEILGRPLSDNGKPDESAKSMGRFMARVPGFLDPEEHPKGRLLSVTGKLSTPIEKRIGEYLYDYPVVDAEARYLWPKEEVYPYPYYRDPFYYPWYPYGYWHPYYRW
ncbi:MAG: Slp family lipoprotein [Gammaproteobacteria bacterium]|nr:Slp family lipoprotein [Gammaproteobacteria bacterium]